MKTLTLTPIPDPFVLSAGTLTWIAQKHSLVDVEETYAVFVDKALAKGWKYRDWNAAFRNYIRAGQMYGGVIYKAGRDHDERWRSLLAQARKELFREPSPAESPQAYKTALEFYRTQPRTNVIDFAKVVKRVPSV